ncbi:hypothetical protein H4Q26_000537 [Puccinia striiformis f. sp. tritici PST-130]|nr:hypothetical protein H4Q26_000537 [Puccinia striiformis f. sp. tritici PST-130]
MDVCDCSACIRHQYLDNNHQRQPGRYLSARNVLKHRMADIQRGLPTIHIARQHRSLALDSSSSENSSSSGIPQPPHQKVKRHISLTNQPSTPRENCKIAIQMIINILHVILNRRDSLENLGYIPRDPRTMIKRAQLDIELTKLSAAECASIFNPNVGEMASSKADTEDAVDDWNRTNQDLQDQGYTSDIQHDEGGIFSGSDDDDDDIFEDILLNGGLQGGFFSQDDIKRFRAGMKHWYRLLEFLTYHTISGSLNMARLKAKTIEVN